MIFFDLDIWLSHYNYSNC